MAMNLCSWSIAAEIASVSAEGAVAEAPHSQAPSRPPLDRRQARCERRTAAPWTAQVRDLSRGSDAVPPGSQWLPDPIDMADYRLGRAIVPLCKNREVLPSPAHLHICGTMRSANTIQTGLKATLQMCKVSKKKSV